MTQNNSSVALDPLHSQQQIQHLHQKSSDYDNSRSSVERVPDQAAGGLQSQLQKKLKLKSKGMFISESSAKVNQSVNSGQKS